MKKALLILLICAPFINVFTQKNEHKLTLDPSVLTGVLENGMTYYIKSNSTPKNRVELSLAVNVGSILEDEDQLGLAHFVEHMAFNGTTNFPKNDLIKYLESLGMKFGPEINAWTSFDETVYGIKVPADSADFLEKGLLVLHDWASQLSFEDEEIDAERGIIYEEWRMGQGAMDRMMRKYLPVIFYNSLYANRLPIGDMEIVMNCPYGALKRFYNDWYRPELMAVIAVGDFNPQDMKIKITELFGKIPSKENPRPRLNAIMPDHAETLAVVATDKEAPISMIQMFYKHPKQNLVNENDYKNNIITSIINNALSERLAEKTLLENPPFAQAFAGYSSFIGPKDIFMSGGIVQNNDITKTLEALVAENQRMKQHGFLEVELKKQKESLLKSAEKTFNERDKIESEKLLQQYQRHFLHPNTPYLAPEYKYELYRKLLEDITIEEVNSFARGLIIDSNIVLVVIAPEKEDIKLPSENEIIKLFNEFNKKSVEPYVYEVPDLPLIQNLAKKGKVKKRIRNKELDYQTLTLSNGIKIVIKNTDFKDDEILFEARSFGGYSVYDDRDDVNGRIAHEIAIESGLGNFNKIELQRKLSGINASVTPYIRELTEGLTGSSSINDFETLLQLIYLSFTQVRVNETAYNSYINRMKGIYEDAMRSPLNAFYDTIAVVASNYHHRARPMSAKLLEETSYSKIRYIVNNRFGDPSNFVFYFVGNINYDKNTKALFEKYLGALPMVNRNETFKDLGIKPPKGIVEKTVSKGQDNQCQVYINFHGDFIYSKQNVLHINTISSILSTRLLEEIREKESGVYTIGAYPRVKQFPSPSYDIIIFFSSDPEREAELTDKVFDIINGFKLDALTENDIKTAVEKEKREFETNLRENSYWKSILIGFDNNALTYDDFLNYNSKINSISKENMKQAAITFFNMNNYFKVKLVKED